MVELAIHNELPQPYAEVLENQVTRVHLSISHNSEDLKNHLELPQDKLNRAVNLLSDDNHQRRFTRTDEFLLVQDLI